MIWTSLAIILNTYTLTMKLGLGLRGIHISKLIFGFSFGHSLVVVLRKHMFSDLLPVALGYHWWKKYSDVLLDVFLGINT